MKFNCKHTVVAKCLKLGAEMMPKHFAGMIFVHLFLAVLPVFGIQISRRIYQLAEKSVLSDYQVLTLLLPVLLYGAYLFLMKSYTIYYERVIVQFGGLLEFEKKTKLILHEKCGKIAMRYYEMPSFYNRLWEAKVASINVYRVVECVITLSGAVLSIVLLSGYASIIHSSFSLLIVLAAIPALFGNVSEAILKSRRRTQLATLAKEEKDRKECTTDIRYTKERIVYESSDFLIQKWKTSSRKLREKEYEVEMQVLKIRTFLMFLNVAATAGVYVLAGYLFFQRKIDYPAFMVAVSATFQLQNQYAQYVQSKESIELINYKYHDLKHQIAVLRSEEDPQKREAFLDEMEAEIRQYEAQNKTGNKVLDTVLTSKSLYCNKNGITFTCVADGTLLDFMDVMDICSIFGNALDNAIECEMKIPNKEKRLIHVTVSRQKAFLILKFENYCEEKLQYQDGNIATTKKDKKYHGYGMKSIRYTVNKYGGAVTIDTKENWFDLKILIPIKEEQGD